MLNHLDLFSGIGGFSLGLERTGGFKTVAFCEIEKFPQKVLNKHWPDIPIYEDVKNVTRERLISDGIERIDIITGGFPCADISTAGKQKGIEAERSGLWSELCRIIGDIRPRYAIVENVTALISGDYGRWFGKVLGDLAEIGFDAEWYCIQPEYVGIPSSRDRVWICAYPNTNNVAQMVVQGRLSLKPRGMGSENKSMFGWLVDKSNMGRSPDGVPDEVDRFKGLGNAVIPQIVELLGRAILEHDQT